MARFDDFFEFSEISDNPNTECAAMHSASYFQVRFAGQAGQTGLTGPGQTGELRPEAVQRLLASPTSKIGVPLGLGRGPCELGSGSL